MTRKSGSKNLPNIKLSCDCADIKIDENEARFLIQHRKTPIKWSEEEIEALEKGVEKYGLRNWKKFLKKYNNQFHSSRRVVDLVNKYNLIKKGSSYYKTQKKSWIQVDKDGNPIEDSLGEVITIPHRFPYDAAKKFAKCRKISGETEFIVHVRDAEDIDNSHSYTYCSRNGKGKLTKIVFNS